MTTAMIRACAVVVALALGAGVAAAQSTITREQLERRFNIRVFGNVLVNAAQHGAELLGVRVRQIDPNIILLSGTTPRAQGFLVDGHGLFFHVEIPEINPAIDLYFQARSRNQAAEAAMSNIRRRLEIVTDPQERAVLDRDLRNLERLLPPGATEQRGRAVAMSGTAPSPTAAPPPVMANPDMEYRRLVTEQLLNAMLDHSHQLGLAADEWLTIAARGSEGPLVPEAVFNDRTTLTLRIKGSDLAEFRAGRLTRDQARARVVISEF